MYLHMIVCFFVNSKMNLMRLAVRFRPDPERKALRYINIICDLLLRWLHYGVHLVGLSVNVYI